MRCLAATAARPWPRPGLPAILWSGWTKTLIFIVVAPMVGMFVGLATMTATFWIFRRTSPARVDQLFRRLQLLSAALFSLMHGANDAQKTMGIITGVLFTAGYISDVRRAVLGRARRAPGHRPRHALGRLAHRPDDGHEDHEAGAGRRVRRGDGCGGGDPHRHA